MSLELPAGWTGKPRRVLVTGCAGFLGSSLTDALLAQGHDVLGVDVFSDYYDPQQKRSHLEDALTSPRFTLVEGDLNQVDLDEVLRDRPWCFHFAAQAGVRASWGCEFDVYIDANVRATQRLLEAIVHKRQADQEFHRLVYSSSSSVYGNQPRYPVAEDVDKHPHSPYGVTKLAAEHMCELYASNYGLPCSSLRYFTVYGPRQRPDMAFRKFLEAARRGEPWVIYGDGEQTRDFTFVEDVVRANLLAADDPNPYGAYNIGGGARISLRDALRVLKQQVLASGLASDVKLEFEEAVRGDVKHTYADGRAAETALGFRAQVGLEQGLAAETRWVLAESGGA